MPLTPSRISSTRSGRWSWSMPRVTVAKLIGVARTGASAFMAVKSVSSAACGDSERCALTLDHRQCLRQQILLDLGRVRLSLQDSGLVIKRDRVGSHESIGNVGLCQEALEREGEPHRALHSVRQPPIDDRRLVKDL